MGHRDRRGLRQHRRDPTTSLNDYPPTTTQEPGEPQPGSASRQGVIPETVEEPDPPIIKHRHHARHAHE